MSIYLILLFTFLNCTNEENVEDDLKPNNDDIDLTMAKPIARVKPMCKVAPTSQPMDVVRSPVIQHPSRQRLTPRVPMPTGSSAVPYHVPLTQAMPPTALLISYNITPIYLIEGQPIPTFYNPLTNSYNTYNYQPVNIVHNSPFNRQPSVTTHHLLRSSSPNVFQPIIYPMAQTRSPQAPVNFLATNPSIH